MRLSLYGRGLRRQVQGEDATASENRPEAASRTVDWLPGAAAVLVVGMMYRSFNKVIESVEG